MTIPLKNCSGCRNDFYNGHNEIGVKRCWSAADGTMVTRYSIGTWTQPTQPGAFTEKRVPNCYHRDGEHFYESLPSFVRAKDVIRTRGGAGP